MKDELSTVSTATEVQGQMMIDKAPQQYDAKHLTEESCSQSRSIQELLQLSSRSKQTEWPYGGNYYREHRFNRSCHREQGSRGREHQLAVEPFQFEISILPRILPRIAEGNRTRNMNSVVTALTTRIDAAVSQVQTAHQQQRQQQHLPSKPPFEAPPLPPPPPPSTLPKPSFKEPALKPSLKPSPSSPRLETHPLKASPSLKPSPLKPSLL